LALLDKFKVLLGWRRVILPKITAHYLTRFGYVPHHGHAAFVLVISPVSVGFVGHNFGGINI
jgi:hypothetical protein